MAQSTSNMSNPETTYRHLRPVVSSHYPEYVDHWAIIVGISKHQHSELNLKFAHRDAQQLYELLQTLPDRRFTPDHMITLIDEQATTANITRALRSFLQKPSREDVVLIYFASHGGPDPNRPSNIYLLTHDTDPVDIPGTALPMREIDLSVRENLLAERVVILADTCHSAAIGQNRRSFTGTSAVNRYFQELSQSKPGIALLTSAEATETAQEGGQWGGGHGVFTYFLLEGLRGAADRSPANGMVTVGELFEYVRENVLEATKGAQHPAIGPATYDRRLPMAVTGDISAQELIELGRCLYEFGRRLYDPALLDASLRRLREADRLSTERRPDVQTEIGKVLLAQDRKEEAIRAFREAVEMKGDQADAWYYLSILEPTKGDASSSLGRHETFRMRFPNDPRAVFVEQWATDPRAGGKNRAIVVGIDEYAEIPELSKQSVFGSGASKNDARKMAKTLHTLDFEDGNVEVLLDAAATKQGILSAVGRLVNPTVMVRTFLFYYSGVGFPDGTPGLIAHDTATEPDRVETVLTTQELHEAIIRVPAVRKVLIIDGQIDEQLERLALSGDYLVLSATSPHEQCWVTDDLAHGAFTAGLLKELESAAILMSSSGDLRSKVVRRMGSTSVSQHPVVWGDPGRPLVEARSGLDLLFELAEARYYGKYSARTLQDLLEWAEKADLHYPDFALSLARAFLGKQDHQRAIRALNAVSVAAGPLYAEALLLSALAHLSASDREAACVVLRQLVAAETDWSSMLNQEIARLIFALGDYELAMAMCRRSLNAQTSTQWDMLAILGLAEAFAEDEAAIATLASCWQERSTTAEIGPLQRIVRFLVTGEAPPERYGVLIGISAYPMNSLRVARAEAERFRDVLIERFDFAPENLVLLLDQDATREKIVGALEHAVTHLHGYESFLFFFSGHSTCDPQRSEPSSGYIDRYVTVDAMSAGVWDSDRMISGSQLHQLICRIPAEDKTVILDSGGPEMTGLARASGNYILFTSASPGQLTMDGVFATLIIDELRKGTSGHMTAGELIDATAVRMGSDRGGRSKGVYPKSGGEREPGQTPQLVGDRERVLFRLKAPSTPSQRVVAARTMAQRVFDPMEIGRTLYHYEYSFTDRAVQSLTRSLRTRSEFRPETYLHLGIAFGLQGDYTRAVDALNKAIAQSTDEYFPKAHYYLGRFLFEGATDYDQAVAELRLATRQDQTDPYSQYYLAQAIRAQVERQSRVEAEAAYRAYAAAGSPLGVDPGLVKFVLPAHQELADAPIDVSVASKDAEAQQPRKKRTAKRTKTKKSRS
jgi:tetratricopeptide (TPR) repeat protein